MKDSNVEIIGCDVQDKQWQDRKSLKFVWESKNSVLVPTVFKLVSIFNEEEFKKFLKESPERVVAGLHFEPKEKPEGNYFIFRKTMQVIVKTTTRADGLFILKVTQRDCKQDNENAKVLPKPKVETPKQDIEKSVITPLGVKNDMGSVQIENIGIPKDS